MKAMWITAAALIAVYIAINWQSIAEFITIIPAVGPGFGPG